MTYTSFDYLEIMLLYILLINLLFFIFICRSKKKISDLVGIQWFYTYSTWNILNGRYFGKVENKSWILVYF